MDTLRSTGVGLDNKSIVLYFCRSGGELYKVVISSDDLCHIVEYCSEFLKSCGFKGGSPGTGGSQVPIGKGIKKVEFGDVVSPIRDTFDGGNGE